MGNGKSPGHDQVKSDLVKLIVLEIAYPLKIIFNKSLSDGVVPDALNIAKVVYKIYLKKKSVSSHLVIIDQYLYCFASQKYLKELFL